MKLLKIVTSSTQKNVNMLKKLKSCFKRTNKNNKYQSKTSTEINI